MRIFRVRGDPSIRAHTQSTKSSADRLPILSNMHAAQTYLEEIAAEGITGSWLIPSSRAKAIPAAATVVRHRFFDEKIKAYLCGLHGLHRHTPGFGCPEAGTARDLTIAILTDPTTTQHTYQGPPTSGARRRSS